jgi:hypothetical protein
MKKYRILYFIILILSKKAIIEQYGNSFYQEFRRLSLSIFNDLYRKTPDIGKTLFPIIYQSCPALISFYKAYRQLGLSNDEAGKMLWKMFETMMQSIPKATMQKIACNFIRNCRKKAQYHERRSLENSTHPYDWKISYREISEDIFELDIHECAIIKLSRDFDALDIFPWICQVDYLIASYGYGLERSKTLADGDELCNSRFILSERSQWPLESGPVNRK